MNGKDLKEIIKTAVSLFLICAVSTAILAYVNGITAPKIAENSVKSANEARLAVMPGADDFNEITLPSGGTGYEALKGGNVIGYVFTTSGSSYGGTIDVMTGFNKDGTVSAITILTISDTPGLGMKAKTDDFYSRFAGKSIAGGDLAVNKDGGEIEAITSATITSRAVTKCVNAAAALWREATEG